MSNVMMVFLEPEVHPCMCYEEELTYAGLWVLRALVEACIEGMRERRTAEIGIRMAVETRRRWAAFSQRHRIALWFAHTSAISVLEERR